MKIDRLLGIVTILLNKDKVKAKDLAEKFEVSIRTIHRDIEDICKSGIPIVTYQGGDGGISISEGYKLDKSLLTRDDLDNIIVGLKSVDSISSDSNVKVLLDKLTPKQENILPVNNNIFIDLTSFYKVNLSEKITTLKESINNRREVCFDYFSEKGTSKRFIEPYFITFKWSSWYVYGYCQLRKDFRLFKLNRMSELLCTDILFTQRDIISKEMELDEYFNQEESVITMLIDRSLEYIIVEKYGVGSYEITEDNRVKFNLYYVNKSFALEFILSLGDKVEVIYPESIIDELKTIAENILKKYK